MRICLVVHRFLITPAPNAFRSFSGPQQPSHVDFIITSSLISKSLTRLRITRRLTTFENAARISTMPGGQDCCSLRKSHHFYRVDAITQGVGNESQLIVGLVNRPGIEFLKRHI
jgi:hypothetical protein